jgi:hypothetical protein
MATGNECPGHRQAGPPTCRGKPGRRRRDGRHCAKPPPDHRAVLTPHDNAISRAGASAKRLDAYIENLRARGAMREFTKTYKRRRLAAAAQGEGFMTFAVAELRLRRAHQATLFQFTKLISR